MLRRDARRHPLRPLHVAGPGSEDEAAFCEATLAPPEEVRGLPRGLKAELQRLLGRANVSARPAHSSLDSERGRQNAVAEYLST
jgi:hypothetical protein